MFKIFRIIFFSLLFTVFFYSCGQKSGEMTLISLRVPTLEELRHSLSADGLGQRSALPPTSIADINCFGVLVSDSTVIDHNNVCHDKFDESLIYARPYKLGGFVPPGGVISIENVQQGSVQFTLVGITKDASLPYCPFANSAPPLEAPDFSDPHFLGTTTTNIVSGVNQVTLRASFSANKLIDCEGDIFGDHARCEMSSTFANIDRNIPDCFYQNSLMESIISSSTVSTDDVYLVRTGLGNFYKIRVTSASESSLNISYQSFYADGSPVGSPILGNIFLNYYFDIETGNIDNSLLGVHDFQYVASSRPLLIFQNSASGVNYFERKGICYSSGMAGWSSIAGGCKNVAQSVVFSSPYGASDDCLSGQSISWVGGVAYCNNLIESGFSDWRMPTFDELNVARGLNTTQKMTTDVSSMFWSSTEEDTANVLVSNFNYMSTTTSTQSKSSSAKLRCVR